MTLLSVNNQTMMEKAVEAMGRCKCKYIVLPTLGFKLLNYWGLETHICIIKTCHHWLTHWGRMTHICVCNLTIIGSYGLLPGRCQAIIWTSGGILLIGPLGMNYSEILNRIQTFSYKKMQLKMSSAKWHPFCLGLNVLMRFGYIFPLL